MTHDEQALHFQSCGGETPDCDCENKRKILKGMLLRRRTHFSARSRCFKVPPSPDLRIESTNSNTVLYEEFRGIGHPSSIPQAPFGQIGDIYVDLTPGNHQLYAKTSPLEWIPWPGPSVPFDDEIHHPLYPDYTLTYRLSQGFGQGQDISGLGWYSSSYTHKSQSVSSQQGLGKTHKLICTILEIQSDEIQRQKESSSKRQRIALLTASVTSRRRKLTPNAAGECSANARAANKVAARNHLSRIFTGGKIALWKGPPSSLKSQNAIRRSSDSSDIIQKKKVTVGWHPWQESQVYDRLSPRTYSILGFESDNLDASTVRAKSTFAKLICTLGVSIGLDRTSDFESFFLALNSGCVSRALEVTSPQSTNNHLATASLVDNGQDPSSSQGAKTAVGSSGNADILQERRRLLVFKKVEEICSMVCRLCFAHSNQVYQVNEGREAPSIMDCHCKSKHPEEWKIINELTGTGLQMLEVTITAKQPNN